MFTGANFPGASAAVLNAARATYAVLTGRVSSINSQAVLDGDTGKYVELGPSVLPGGIKVYGAFAQDSWRVKPTLTFTGGLRYEVQTPFAAHSDVMSAVTMESICGRSGLASDSTCNVLKPGTLTGTRAPEFIQLKKGTAGYKTDWNNVSPSLSVAWRPNVKGGFLRGLLGDPDQATFRSGYSVAYERQGLTRFTGLYGSNTGVSKSLTRNVNTGLVPEGESWPILLSQPSRLNSGPFDENPAYPIAIRANRADSVNAFAPNIQIAKVQNWTVGFARSISRDTAVEVRYIGNYGDNEWSGVNNNEAINYNAIRTENLVANGFLNEFTLAMANLQANNAAGGIRVGSFAYFGPGSGTNPLPIYLAYLNGRTDATNPANYINPTTTWANSALAERLVATNPNPVASAADLEGNLIRRTQGQSNGYPANFFVLNPDVSSANVIDSVGYSNYHAVQFDLRRRLSRGLSANINYQYAPRQGIATFDGFSLGHEMIQNTLNYLRHAVKTQWDWTVPVGRGERFGNSMHPVVNAVAGGWSLNLVGRVQAQVVDLGNVRLVGMSKNELQKMYFYRIKDNPATNVKEVWMLPDDVILNTRRAFSVLSTTINGYSTSLGAPEGKYIAPANSASCVQIRAGDCAPRQTLLLAPWFKRFDFGATKRLDLIGRTNVELRFDVLNVFDSPNFNPAANPGSGATIFRTTSAYTDSSNTYDPGGRIGQFMVRFNW